MSLQDLALPVDPPFNLIATSNDMLAHRNNIFPNSMWKSSLAVFAYDPDLSDLPEVFPDRALTFLKVVCSITSFAPGCQDLPPPPVLVDELYQQYEDDLKAWKEKVAEQKKFEKMTFPCSGALVQVAIYPKNESPQPPNQPQPLDISKLAYFASFEPKKRELIEVVTESGESITQSKSAVDIRKGVTSTDSTENLDVFTGANVNVGYAGAQVGVGVSGQWGTIKKSSSDRVDTTTTDTSREAREGASHTTSLSQLYHLLNSYHLGTNRAIFFLQSRPHTVQQKDRFTFIDGPQEIEGIQEFFLVVSRPKTMSINAYCVDALLYTAHLDRDSMRVAIMEPKIIETPWYELWAAAEKPQPHDGGWSLGDIALAVAETAVGIPPDAVVASQEIANHFGVHTSDELAQLFNQPSPAPNEQARSPQLPTILDRYISFPGPSGIGWRIDRTRGLGGYDLWEDPDNTTADPLGNVSLSKAKPQAFIEILSNGNPDDPEHYRSDSTLHIRAYVWTPQGGGIAMYHGRIKVYFIRDDSPTDHRTIPMFVTARGVSTCSDSPFAQFYKTTEVDPAQQPDIATEGTISPPNIAPWLNPPWATPAVPAPTPKDATPPPPINSAKPSGLDPFAIGSARVKMANAVSDQVRIKLKASLVCPFQSLIPFHETDFYFNKVAQVMIAAEVNRLGTGGNVEKNIASYVAAHSVLPTIIGAIHPTLALLRSATSVEAAPSPPVKPLAASSSFPVLTLGGQTLSHADRQALHKAGVLSGLDLVNIPASELALRLGVDERRARQIRLHAIGLGTEKVTSGPPSSSSSKKQEVEKSGGAATVKRTRKK
jgi:hypothetical protein